MVSRSLPMVTKSAELDSLFQQVREKHGRIDVLYVNAGIAKLGELDPKRGTAGAAS